MKTKIFLALVAIAGILVFASCKEDEDPSPLKAEKAEVAISDADTDFNTVKGEFMSSTGMAAEEAIGDLGLPFGSPIKSMAKMNVSQQEVLKSIGQKTSSKGGYGPDYIYFAFYEYVGTWEKVEGVWTKTLPTPTDKVVIKFSFNGGTNNGTLTYSDYITKASPLVAKGESTYISQLKAKIDIEGQTNPVMTWVYTATQTTLGGIVKTTSTYGSEYSVKNELSAYTSTSGTITVEYLFSAKKNGDVVFSKSFTCVLKGFSKNLETYSADVTAQVRIMNLLIKYSIFIDQDTDTSNPGNFMKVSLWLTSGAKVADVVFEGQENDPYFEYSDGTRVSIESLLSEDLLYELEEFMNDIMWFF